jgi:very-short-patch-repair endonuclease
MPIKKKSPDWEHWDIPSDLKHKLTQLARQQRKEPTRSEHMAWQALRDRKLGGFKFRRHQPLGPFILDFYCAQMRLAIEIDGPIHALQPEADAISQELIEALGISFLRFTATHVENNLRDVLGQILAYLNQPEPDASLPVI